MMFQLFEAIADRVRDQAADYASAQARIGARTLAHLVDPLGLTAATVEPSPALAAGADLHPARPSSERHVRSSSRATVKQPQRQGRGLASTFA